MNTNTRFYSNQGDDDEVPFRVPDRDVYRRNVSTFGSVQAYLQNRLYVRSWKDRRIVQPHYAYLKNIITPYGNRSTPADGICAHFLRKGLIKPSKIQMNAAVWSADARWLVLGTHSGDLALWEGDTLKVHKVVSVPAHKILEGDTVKECIPITAMAWNNHGNLLVSGDRDGVMQYCDETFRNVCVIREAHNGPIRGLSYSPLDSKLVSCSDDSLLHIWGVGQDNPERTLVGHQSDVKSVDWHPYRALIASASRDATVRLWDPKQEAPVSSLFGHKKQVNVCSWNKNGNWLASGSKDGLIKVYDIRTMREMEVFRGQMSDICSLGWHPQHESLLLSGGYNGSLIYWLCGHNQAPHTIIADAHRQSIDVIAWHPAGHCVGTASHDGILKFWCREPPGSKLEQEVKEFQDCPVFAHGPLEVGAPSVIPLITPLVPGAANSGFGGGDFQNQGQGHYPRQQQGAQPGGGPGGQFHAKPFFGGRGEAGGRGRGDGMGMGRGRGDGRGGRGAGRGLPSDSSGGGSYYQLQPGVGVAAGPPMPQNIQGLPGAAGMRKKTRFE